MTLIKVFTYREGLGGGGHMHSVLEDFNSLALIIVIFKFLEDTDEGEDNEDETSDELMGRLGLILFM